jgi:hypothetical protein
MLENRTLYEQRDFPIFQNRIYEMAQAAGKCPRGDDRLSDFQRLFDSIMAAEHLFGDQYLYVVADLAPLQIPVSDPDDAITFPADCLDTVLSIAESPIGDAEAVWGAASKGVIYSLLRARSGNPVNPLIDINPAKVGRFVPGTGLRVSSSTKGLLLLRPGATIRVMNSNYLEEIRQITGDRLRLEGVKCE